MGALAGHILTFIKTLITIYDTLTAWAYTLIQRPAKTLQARNQDRAEPTDPIQPGDTSVTYKPIPLPKTALVNEYEMSNCTTMAEVWKWSVARYRSRKLLGTRDVLGEEDEIQSNGKAFRKLLLGEYRWLNYEEVDQLVDNVGRGMRMLGIQPTQPVCLFADTRSEWFVTAQASFRHSFPVVTLYTNLGDEAIAHGINQTEVETVITSHELLPKFKNIEGLS